MIRIRKAEERGHADHGWLNTYHTFSFNTYYDEHHMGFRSLRVINEDRVKPGKGFGTHPHKDMEIISYVVEGALEHQDSLGTGSVIRPGDVQRMSAGSGVLHSEFNPSDSEPVHFLQIWIKPSGNGYKPSYEQKRFSRESKTGRLRLIASPDGREGSVTIGQDANVFATILKPEMELSLPVDDNRHLWVQIIKGRARLGEQTLKAGDGAAISDEKALTMTGVEECEALVFDLA